MTMTELSKPPRRFPDARADQEKWERQPATPQTESPSYRLAFADPDFLKREELRAVRLQLELLKPELIMREHGIVSTVVIFGGARVPDPAHPERARNPQVLGLAPYYTEAQEFARLVTEKSLASNCTENVICSGGGPGVMEAANRGAAEAGGCSISLNIVLPHEQVPNLYGTPELSFNFHYFGIRKMHFLLRAKAVAVFPGGFGTLDELFETLTLIQTKRMAPMPILLFGEDFWHKIIDWEALAASGTIAPDDLKLFRFVDTAAQAVAVMDTWPGQTLAPGQPVGEPAPPA